MRIAFFSWESLHSVAVGGVAAHVTELSAALTRRGHEVHNFVRLGENQTTYECIDGVHYHRCPIDLHPDFITEMNNMGNSFVYFMGETEAHQGSPFDVVHGHDWMTAKGVVQAKNDRQSRTVLTFHSTEYGRCGNHFRNGNCDRVREIEREGAYCADRAITVSGVLADEVKWQYEVPEWKLRTVYNGVDCSRYDGEIDPSICRASYGVGPLDPMVLFAGRLSEQKGPDILLEAVPGILEHRPDAKIVFAGDGDLRGPLEHRAWELGVQHAVRFLGAMDPNGDLVNLFKSTDCVCVPSRNEPFGIVVLEAWAAGKPVVATQNGGPRDFVTHGEDGYLVFDNANSVCWGVNTVFGDFTHAQWMGQRGRVKAAYGFAWDAIAEKTESVYQELLV
ncbi:MAG: glycosyltransferase family 4 protein [Planctomycetota bacterium]